MKPVFGVSVYPDIEEFDDIREYLKNASSCGFTRVFSSMFTVKGTKEEVLAYFTKLDKCAHEYGMQVSLDVNPECFRRIGASPSDLSVFRDIGCDIVRMDMSFPMEEELLLLNNPCGLKIEFNASMKTADDVRELMKHGVKAEDMLFCHNFYPQRYTGFRWDRFLSVSRSLAETGVRVAAFVSSNAPDTHGVWGARHGLPTVERLRGLPVSLQTRIMMASGCVSDILIGNAFASLKEMQEMQKAAEIREADENSPLTAMLRAMDIEVDYSTYTQHRMHLRFEEDAAEIEKTVILDFFPHIDMGDSSEWMWRSRGPRFGFRNTDRRILKRECAKEYFEPGDVLVVNETSPSYMGEVQIVRLPMENDGERNLAGHLDKGEEILLDLVRDGEILVFEESDR